MTFKERHTFQDRYILGEGIIWMGESLAGILNWEGKPKRLKRPSAMDRHSYWDRPKYRLVFERIK